MSDIAATFYEQLVALERDGTAFVLVILTESLGSTPQDTGAKMLVTATGLHTGTVGAGKVVQALVPVLAPLDCQITVVDPRREWLDKLPRARNARYLEAAEPAD